jgi:hypothetical protein
LYEEDESDENPKKKSWELEYAERVWINDPKKLMEPIITIRKAWRLWKNKGKITKEVKIFFGSIASLFLLGMLIFKRPANLGSMGSLLGVLGKKNVELVRTIRKHLYLHKCVLQLYSKE